MTDEEKRIKVAESCGWHCEDADVGYVIPPAGTPERKAYASCGIGLDCLPDYLNDLNAMHKAEDILFDHPDLEVGERYCHWLVEVCVDSRRESIRATAAQRAEAFVLTMEAPQG